MTESRKEKSAQPSSDELGAEPATLAGREETGRTPVQEALDVWAAAAVERSLMGSLRLKLTELEGLIEQLRRSRGRK